MDWQQIEKKGPWDDRLVLRPSTRINSKRYYEEEVEADYMFFYFYTPYLACQYQYQVPMAATYSLVINTTRIETVNGKSNDFSFNLPVSEVHLQPLGRSGIDQRDTTHEEIIQNRAQRQAFTLATFNQEFRTK